MLTNCRHSQKLQGSRWLEVKSVDTWCDRSRFFHFEIGVSYLLHISSKTHRMICITTSICDWIRDVSCLKKQISYKIEWNISFFLQKLNIFQYVPWCAVHVNGARSGWPVWLRPDFSIKWFTYMDVTYVCRFIINMFYCGRILLNGLNSPISNVSGSASGAQRLLMTSIVRRQFPSLLTHWGRVTHICVSKLTIIS